MPRPRNALTHLSGIEPIAPEDRTAYVRCRTLAHAWDDVPSPRRPPWGVLMALRCVRCGTIREDIVNRFDGELMSRNYVYPEGYRDSDGLDRKGWRVAYLDAQRVPRPRRKPTDATVPRPSVAQ